MPKILLVEGDHNQKHLYTVILENLNPNVVVVEADSGNHAIEMLDRDSEAFDIIISDYKMKDGDGYKLFKYIEHKQLEIPFMIISADQGDEFLEDSVFMDSEHFMFFEKPMTESVLRNAVSSYIEIDMQTSFDPEDISENFCKIQTLFFLRFNKTEVPIYLKLSNKKFVKLFHEQSKFGPEEVDRYLKRGVDYLYIARSDYDEFKVTLGSTPFLSQIEGDDMDLSPSGKWSRTQAVFSALLVNYGIDKEVLDKGFLIIEGIRKKVEIDPDLKSLVGLVKNSENFYSDHGLLTALLCEMLTDKLEWGSKENLEKLVLAAVFHDVTLDPDIANIMESLDMDMISSLSKEEQDQYFSHSKDISDLLNENESVHSEVATIVYEHHERPDGTGFPKGSTSKDIHPLSAVFILVHDFVEQLYVQDFDKDKFTLILNCLSDKYSGEEHFGSVFSALVSIFEEFHTENADGFYVPEEESALFD